MKDEYFFMHMPKTGGTSMRQALNKAFTQEEIFPNRREMKRYNGYPSIRKLLKVDKELLAQKRLLRGHYPFVVADTIMPNAKKIVFLRSPVERSISFLFHMQRRSPETSLEEILETKARKLSNRQVQFFADNDVACETFKSGEVDQSSLENAIANLEKCWFVGITERFDESMNLCRAMLGIDQEEATVRNRGGYEKAQVTDALLSRIKEINALDEQLYRRGLELFDELHQAHLGNDGQRSS